MNQELVSRDKGTIEKLPFIAVPFILVPAAIGFFFKKRAMPVCHYRIDESKIVITTDDRPYEMGWKNVVAVYSYPRGYLLTSSTGAFPLPHRCFDASQASALNALLEGRKSELQATTK
jgi:hypothetical protein